MTIAVARGMPDAIPVVKMLGCTGMGSVIHAAMKVINVEVLKFRYKCFAHRWIGASAKPLPIADEADDAPPRHDDDPVDRHAPESHVEIVQPALPRIPTLATAARIQSARSARSSSLSAVE